MGLALLFGNHVQNVKTAITVCCNLFVSGHFVRLGPIHPCLVSDHCDFQFVKVVCICVFSRLEHKVATALSCSNLSLRFIKGGKEDKYAIHFIAAFHLHPTTVLEAKVPLVGSKETTNC